MPSSPQFIPLDLDRYAEGTRKRLYDLIGAFNFSSADQAPEDDRLPYSPEDAGLSVLFVWGRWFAIWTRCEVDGYRPESERIEVLRIKATTENAEGWMLHEV